MSQVIIEMHNVTKKVNNNKKTVLHDVNLTIERGDSVALIGVNGTGKSTLLRLISGLTPITSGKILTVPNLKFAFIPEHFPKLNMTVDEYMHTVGRIDGLSKHEISSISKKFYELFFIQDMVDVPIKHLSKGSIQKVSVIQALLKKPDVLIMDEPLAGQDIKSQKNFMKIVKELNDEGVTLIMSCHELFLMNQLAKKAYEIKGGTLHNMELRKKVELQKSKAYDIMLFDKGSGLSNVNAEVLKWVYDRVESDEVIQIVIERDKSNEVLQTMLKDGFILRGMKGVQG